MPKVIRCSRCGRRLRNPASQAGKGWNVEMKGGEARAYLCPDCQTPEENAEAEINEATLDYFRLPGGQVFGQPKAGE